ncbi:ABC1 kinase family protein [Pseudonocardia acaciae]|uniref:ABC1 kinase family protein n=1 Tax=Pseudonocardia acaciae TaxID=551276 RepID=UPI000688E102|nr:AarF/UbiB family protein [Pseudonocardia acaciae]
MPETAAGPPAEALGVRRPPLDRFGLAELGRIVVVCAVLGGGLLRAWLRWALGRHGGRTRAEALSDGAIDAFGRLGPMFVKLGQLMASSPGLFPYPLSEAAGRCLDDMPPFPAARARRLVAEELGRPVSELFAEFDDAPLASASIAQVHACVLPDGRPAVLKVQRPGIGRRMIVDLRIMYRLAHRLDGRVELVRLISLAGIVEQLYEVTCQELNFALEARNQERFGGAVAAFGDNEHVTVPEVHWRYCSPRVICMQRLYGTPLDRPAELAARGVDGGLALRRGVKAWLEAAAVHGPFHGDAHAGNIWVLDDGRLAFLDFGIMGELAPCWRALLRDALYTTVFDRDFERVARGLRDLGVLDPEVGTDAQLGLALRTVFGPLLDVPLARLDTRKIIDMLLSTARQFSGENPPELTLFAKQLIYFERYSRALAPGWVLSADPFVLRNIFPADAAARAAELGVPMPD